MVRRLLEMIMNQNRLEELKIDRKADPETRRRGGVLVLILAGAMIAIVSGFVLTRPGAAEVTVAPVRELSPGGTSAVLNASGYVTARRAATVSSKVTGKVTEVLVEEGMKVEQGQVLARLDAEMQSRALSLSKSQVAAAASALEETRVRIAQARLDLDRARKLTSEQVASQSDLDNAKAELDALQARLASQSDELEVARRQLALRQQDLSDLEIRAPFAGIVVTKDAQPGEMISPVSAGGGFTRTGICTIVDMSSLEIEVDVNEAYINRVEAGMPVEAVLDAYPDWKIPGHVITVVPTANREKATVRVRIAFDQKDPRILPDMGVKVSFLASGEAAESNRPAITIPRDALRQDGEKDIVFVAQDGRVERRAVSVGQSDGDRVEITSGLTAGENVVVTGPDGLGDGDRVKVVEEKS